jgi:uncharacterized protein with von Willebrand factor type A (vWA) domain
MTIPAFVSALDEFAFALRTAGVPASLEQVLAAARALSLVGLENRERSRVALLACLTSTKGERVTALRVFDEFFVSHRRARSVEEALRAAELALTLDVVRAWLERERVVDREADLAFLLHASLAENTHPPAMMAHAVTNKARLNQARHRLGTLGVALRGAFDADVADRALEIVERFIEGAMQRTRDAADERHRTTPRSDAGPGPEFTNAAVDKLLRQAASQLRCRLRRRQRKTHGQAIDPRALLREQTRTHGVPLRVPRLRNRRRPPALYFLCDVSDSTRPAVDLLLQFMTRASRFFKQSRCYIFASTTVDFTRHLAKDSYDKEAAFDMIHRSVAGQVSNYGAAIREFARLARSSLDRRSVVVMLGDGRANYRDPGLTELTALRHRVRDLVWLCSEPKERWSADSLMPRYRAIASRNGQLASFHDVAASARLIGSLR